MIIFINNKSTKFRQLTLRITRFIHKRKVVPFSRLTVYIVCAALADTPDRCLYLVGSN